MIAESLTPKPGIREQNRHKAALCVGEVDGELTRRQVRLLKGQIGDRRFDLVRDLVPDPPRSRLAIRRIGEFLTGAAGVIGRRVLGILSDRDDSGGKSRNLTCCFLRLATLDNGVFERLGPDEAALWRHRADAVCAR
jgi:hypothetical protein